MKAQISLRIGTVSPGPTLYTYSKYKCKGRLDKNEKSSFTSKLRMHVCFVFTSDCSVCPVHCHRLVRAYNLSRSIRRSDRYEMNCCVMHVLRGYNQ